jgi:predicted protein tyrosine phosphatase
MANTTNVLFVCSRNKWRSPTAETIWQKHPQVNARSAGTSAKARRTVSADDISWADIIFVMEQKHKNRLKAEYSRFLMHKSIHVLEIPDEYQYMDPDLVQILKESVSYYLDL